MFLVVTCCVAAGHSTGSVWADDANAPIVVRGSSTLLPVVEKWAAEFDPMSADSSFDIEATGTGEGISDLIAGKRTSRWRHVR